MKREMSVIVKVEKQASLPARHAGAGIDINQPRSNRGEAASLYYEIMAIVARQHSARKPIIEVCRPRLEGALCLRESMKPKVIPAWHAKVVILACNASRNSVNVGTLAASAKVGGISRRPQISTSSSTLARTAESYARSSSILSWYACLCRRPMRAHFISIDSARGEI